MELNGESVARCTYNGNIYAYYLMTDSSLNDVRRGIQSIFGNMDLSEFALKYSLNGGSRCNLDSDRDVQMMFASQNVSKSDFIDVEVVTKPNELNEIAHEQGEASMEIDDPIMYCNPELLGGEGSEHVTSLTDPWKSYITDVKQVFYGGAKQFREHLTKYVIAFGFQIRFIKNDNKRVTAVCAKKWTSDCPWRIHASVSKINGNFYLRTFNNVHTCGGNITTRRGSMVSSRLVSLIIRNMIRKNPMYKPTDIIRDMKSNFGLDVGYWNAWYGRELARTETYGSDGDSYRQLVLYIYYVQQTNPGSYCRIEYDSETRRFTRCFVAFGACIEGFKLCRPFLCLDGAHLKGKHKGTMLAATGKNGESGLYPLTFAIVDNESDESWSWFAEHLNNILLTDGRIITLMSDRNNELINAVKEWFPEYPHAYCYHHLRVNLQANYPGSGNKDTRETMLRLFTKCAYTFSKRAFHKTLDQLKREGGATIEQFLGPLPFKNWANSYFSCERYGEMCSNIVESFNSLMIDERSLPITQLLDGVRSKLMKFIGNQSYDASKWTTVLCPKHEKILQNHVKEGQHWIVNRSSGDVFEVLADYTWKVDLFERSCTCNKWKLNGFPCAHAVTVMKFIDVNPYEYVDSYFTTEAFRECYSHSIMPVIQHADDLSDDDEIPELLPPKTKTQPGRPRTNHIKSTGEVGKLECGRCGQMCGHNRRTCSENI